MELEHRPLVGRGRWQREIEARLLSGHSIQCPVSLLEGNARRYSDRYRRSFDALLLRLRLTGRVVVRVPGVRGGEWGATYTLCRVPDTGDCHFDHPIGDPDWRYAYPSSPLLPPIVIWTFGGDE